MELDDFKAAWAAHGAALERSISINARLLRETLLGKVRRRMAPFVVGRAIEVALGVLVLLSLAPVVVAHVGEARYLVCGVGVLVLAAWLTTSSAYSLVQGLRLPYDGPVVAMRAVVERLTIVETWATVCAVLGGTLLWLPALCLGFEAVTGVPALARIDLAYLVANLLVGAVVLVLGSVAAKRRVARTGAPRGRLADALTGWSLVAAARELEELEKFEREP